MLFGAANEARERGSYDEAIRLYSELTQQDAQSPEAVTVHAILGRLLLDRGDAPEALRHFEAYLSTGVTKLREEALLGRALALQELHRPGEEAQAWGSLLEAHPRSVHAARARMRLSLLETR
jgi:tetratricopeptide (TPR) repeat protein